MQNIFFGLFTATIVYLLFLLCTSFLKKPNKFIEDIKSVYGGSLIFFYFFTLFFFFPIIFKYMAINVWGVAEDKVKNISDLGSIGDIFGSLNTFVTLITFGVLLYSIRLQLTSLNETRNATTRQLELAEENHKEQLKESKYSNFTTIFYALLNHKNLNYKNLDSKDNYYKTLASDEIFIMISRRFIEINRKEWSINSPQLETVRNELTNLLAFGVNNLFYAKLNSHFKIYSDLLFLINKSELDLEDKKFFIRLVANSMTIQEQISLLWFSSFNSKLKNDLDNSGLIEIAYSKFFINFLMKFHNISLFSDQELIEEWKKIEETNQTPT